MRRLCLALVASLFLAAPAAAGGCCGGYAATYEIQPEVPVSTYRYDAPLPVGQVYVVNQGPFLSGAGIYAYTNHYVPSFVPAAYPYVSGCGGCGHTYSYGCGSCGHSYGYGCGHCGYYWPNTVATWPGGYYGQGGYFGYRRYGYRHRPVAHAAPGGY